MAHSRNRLFFFFFFFFLQEVYREAGLETKKENRVSLTVMFSSETFQALEKNLTTVSLFLFFPFLFLSS